MSDIVAHLEGAITAGIRQAIADEGSAISYHEHRATPDLDWVYGQASGIAEYITTSKPWQDLVGLVAELKAARAELDGAKSTIAHMSEAMSWISGHDRSGQDHLDDAMRLAGHMDAIRLSHAAYESALSAREHGAVAADRFIRAVTERLTAEGDADD